MNKLQRIEEMERQLAALKAEVEQEVKPKQWEPEGGVYSVLSSGKVVKEASAENFKLFGTERKTREQAEKAAAAMRTHNRLLAYVAEFAPDWEFSFGNSNWYVFTTHSGNFSVNYDMNVKGVDKCYMPKHVAEELCRKLNSGEVVL